jgi:alpha/beta superfamily hydrolase
MQLLMRRPEIEGFISIAPMANRYDFSFLAPCPSSGLIVHGSTRIACRSRTSMAVSRS